MVKGNPKVIIYTKDSCPYCRLAKELLSNRHIAYEEIRVDLDENKLTEMINLSNKRTVPQIFINDQSIGGYDDLAGLVKSGKLDDLLNSSTKKGKFMSQAQANGHTPQFEIQRIFLKDLSFEAPNTPHTFVEDWKPEVSLNLETKSNRVQDNLHEVVLSVTATVSTQKKTAFLIEVHLAGVFMISGFPNDQLHQTLGSFCPNILFPYAREVVSDIVVRGGFPQLILAPVNFDALYTQHMEQQNKETTSEQKAN